MLAPLPAEAVPSDGGTGGRGSLAISIATKDGIVLMADRLCIRQSDGEEFEVNKLVKCGKNTVIVTVGLAFRFQELYSTARFPKINFNVNQIVKNVLAKHDLNGSLEPLLPEIGEAVLEQYLKRFESPRAAFDGPLIVQATLYHYDSKQKRFEAPSFEIIETGETISKPQLKLYACPFERLKWSRALLIGDYDYLGKIFDKDVPVQNSRLLQTIRKYLRSTQSAESLSVNDAIKVLSAMFFLVQEYDERSQVKMIGPTVDAVLLTPSGLRTLIHQHKYRLPEVLVTPPKR